LPRGRSVLGSGWVTRSGAPGRTSASPCFRCPPRRRAVPEDVSTALPPAEKLLITGKKTSYAPDLPRTNGATHLPTHDVWIVMRGSVQSGLPSLGPPECRAPGRWARGTRLPTEWDQRWAAEVVFVRVLRLCTMAEVAAVPDHHIGALGGLSGQVGGKTVI